MCTPNPNSANILQSDSNMDDCSSEDSGYSTEELNESNDSIFLQDEANGEPNDENSPQGEFLSTLYPRFTLGKDSSRRKKFARYHSQTRDKTPQRIRFFHASSDRIQTPGRKISPLNHTYPQSKEQVEETIETRSCNSTSENFLPLISPLHSLQPTLSFQDNSKNEEPQYTKNENDSKFLSLVTPEDIDYRYKENEDNFADRIMNSKFIPCKPSTSRSENFKLSVRRTVSDVGSPPLIPPKNINGRLRNSVGSRITFQRTDPLYEPKLPCVRENGCIFISVDTVSDLFQGKYSNAFDDFVIIDCRYTYEYEGGHVLDAISILPVEREERLQEEFMRNPKNRHRRALIFHCEFSSKRGPATWRKLRELDRLAHGFENELYYPYCYVMQGGYQSFFREYPQYCTGGYVEMKDKRFKAQLSENKRKEKKVSRSKSAVTMASRRDQPASRPQSLSFSQH